MCPIHTPIRQRQLRGLVLHTKGIPQSIPDQSIELMPIRQLLP